MFSRISMQYCPQWQNRKWELCRYYSKDRVPHLTINKCTYLLVRSVCIKLFIEVIQYRSVVDPLQLHIGIIETRTKARIMPLHVAVVLLYILIRYYLVQPEQNPIFILFLTLRQSNPLMISHPGRNAIPERHIEKVDKIIFVILDVVVKKFDQKSVNGKDICVNTHLVMQLVDLFSVSFLLHHPLLDQLLYPGCLLEF